MRAMRLVTALRNKPYQERLKALDLPTLDKHWALQELKYDWEAELSGTGSRSRVEF